MTDQVTEKYGARELLCAGGVMSSTLLQRAVAGRYPSASFAEPALSSDNAVGIAALTARAYRRNGEGGKTDP